MSLGKILVLYGVRCCLIIPYWPVLICIQNMELLSFLRGSLVESFFSALRRMLISILLTAHLLVPLAKLQAHGITF